MTLQWLLGELSHLAAALARGEQESPPCAPALAVCQAARQKSVAFGRQTIWEPKHI